MRRILDNPAQPNQGAQMYTSLLYVALGGAIGSVLRHVLITALASPWATVVVNVLGSAVIGALFVLLAQKGSYAPLLMTGVLGGFTTFSSFSLDTLKLMQSGQFGVALLYVAVSVGLSLIAVACGAALAKGALA